MELFEEYSRFPVYKEREEDTTKPQIEHLGHQRLVSLGVVVEVFVSPFDVDSGRMVNHEDTGCDESYDAGPGRAS
jgi:hypothetical protein